MTVHNSIIISSGHGKYVRGAADILDEVNEARKIVERVAEIWREAGIEVKTYHDDTSHSQNENLDRIVSYHNNQVRTLDVSVHLNAYQHTTKAMGTEVLYLSQHELAGKVSKAMADAGGFINRGPKKSTSLYFLNCTSEDAILLEICFVDSSADADLYRESFDAICHAIAVSIHGKAIGEVPARPEPPDEGLIEEFPGVPAEPEAPDYTSRPTIQIGAYGQNVREIQDCLNILPDGDFGPQTKNRIIDYQESKGLDADGVVGPMTWAALDADFNLSPYPPPLPPAGLPASVTKITDFAINHPIASYSWNDRGRAPAGYIKGMALAYAQVFVRWRMGDHIAKEMAKANTHDDDKDALSWYSQGFKALGLSNEEDGLATLRHLYVLVLGLGMRESSGEHCCGRDQSASNTDSNTCEAGLFQTSWNARNCCTDFVNLFDQYDLEKSYAEPIIEAPQGYLDVWSEGVSCSSSEWQNYGTGAGYIFQEMCKHIPTFAVETCAIGLRNLRQHWGPINRREVELRKEADDMFQEIEGLVEELLMDDPI